MPRQELYLVIYALIENMVSSSILLVCTVL
jgi:hypothetical protein